jgi:glycosyltransferase
MQLPHPAVFVRREVLDRLNPPLDPSYNYAADLKQQLILVEKYGCKVTYIGKELTCMRLGGESTGSLRGVVSGWQESARAYREVHGKLGAVFTLKKVAKKFRQVAAARQPDPVEDSETNKSY